MIIATCVPGTSNTRFIGTIEFHKVSFLKSLEPSHGVLQLLKKNFYSVLILHLLKSLISVFHVFEALSISLFFVLVNNLYVGDPLEANKTQEICIFQ